MRVSLFLNSKGSVSNTLKQQLNDEKMKNYSFEKLDVWNKAKNFTINVYKITKAFPDEEKYGMVSQIRRASVSIASNIAEGSSRNTAKDQQRFYTIAYSTSIEVLNHLIISYELELLEKDLYAKLRKELETITKLINRLHNSLN